MGGGQQGRSGERKMGAVTTIVLAIAGLVLSWLAVEVACKPCLESGRAAMNRDLDPDYDPDDELDGGPGSQAGNARNAGDAGSYSEAPAKQPKEGSSALEKRIPPKSPMKTSRSM